ncbi:MAG TPA: hypothetical protein GX717_00735 [Clostridiaceae bacterium]|nr:hypothetical protein [Clostridiaceae bacterium]
MQRKYVNIPEWHEKGYLGQGLSVFCDDVGGSHVAIVADIIQTILPKARVYTGGISYVQKNNAIASCTVNCRETNELLPFDEFVVKYDIGLINNSTDGGYADRILPIAEYMKDKIKKYNLIFCGAAGNGGALTQKYYGACIVVASCRLVNGKIQWSYMSTGEGIDFTMFNGFVPGTSFSSPFLLGMAGLLRCKYPGITQPEVYEYFKTHAQDILEPGKDEKSGWGLPIMGDPKTVIKMQIGNHKITVDGKPIILDQAPVYNERGDRTLVPLRAIAEAFGATVDWDEATKTVTIVR